MKKAEYYKCISKECEPAFTFGKIYKIVNPDSLEEISNFISNFGTPNGYCGENYKRFEPYFEQESKPEDHSYLIKLLKDLV